MDYLVKAESASLDSFGGENKSDGRDCSDPLVWSRRTAGRDDDACTWLAVKDKGNRRLLGLSGRCELFFCVF
jgi:hypothetical protein